MPKRKPPKPQGTTTKASTSRATTKQQQAKPRPGADQAKPRPRAENQVKPRPLPAEPPLDARAQKPATTRPGADQAKPRPGAAEPPPDARAQKPATTRPGADQAKPRPLPAEPSPDARAQKPATTRPGAAEQPPDTRAPKQAKPRLAAAQPPDARDEIEAAIRRQPDDAAAWLVLADLLQSAGDPRGELIALQQALAAAPDDAKLRRAERTHLKQHAAALLGEAGPLVKGLVKGDRIEPVWRFGFWRRVCLFQHADHSELPATALRDILASPSARFLEALKLEIRTSDSRAFLAPLRAAPSTLRDLRISSMNGPLKSLAKLWPHVPQLRVLHLGQWGGLDLGDLDLPQLEDLELVGPGPRDLATIIGRAPSTLRRLHIDCYEGVGAKKLAPLLAGKLPQLRDLRLQISGKLAVSKIELGGLETLGLSRIDGKALRKLVAACGNLRDLQVTLDDDADPGLILDGALPQLRCLRLGLGSSLPIDRIARSKLLPQLEALYLFDASDDEVQQLARLAPAFAHLQRLVLIESSSLADDVVARARKKLPQLEQQYDSWIED